jgi:hypothetical protein
MAAIAMVLLMASATLIVMPVFQVKAQLGAQGGTLGAPLWGPLPAGVTPDVTVTTYAYLAVTANPIGVGQQGLINIWTTPSAGADVYASGYVVTMIKPDNTTVKIGPMNSYYADRTDWFNYVFDQVGTWKLTFDYPGNYYPTGMYNSSAGTFGGATLRNYTQSRWYKPSSTPYVTELTVQNEVVPSWPPAPLPTHEYWTRPVSLMNREWWPLLGNYPYDGSGENYAAIWPANTNYYKAATKYNAFAVASNTAHIVWKRQDAISGLTGGPAGIDALSSSGSPPGLIYAGRCYQTRTVLMPNGSWLSCATCYDLRTGEQYYAVPTGLSTNPGVTPTYIQYWLGQGLGGPEMEEVPGSNAGWNWAVYLLAFASSSISGTGFMYRINPLTGLVTTNVTVLSGGTFIDPYMITVQTNNTATGPRLIKWLTNSTTANFTSRIVANYSVAFTSIGTNVDWQTGLFGSMTGLTIPGAFQAPQGLRVVGYDINTGQMTCNATDDLTPYTTSQVAVDHGKIACLMENGYAAAYDLRTGKRAWISQQTYSVGGYPWGIWGAYSSASYGGNYIIDLYDGIYAFDWETGKISWVYKAPSVAFEDPYSGWTPFNVGCSIVDGKIYVANSEHTQSEPLARGWKLHCINATTGQGIWNISGPMTAGAMADGYTTAGSYDGYMYVFGRGKSATTVTATPAVISKGSTLMIQGTVLDQSPARPGAACVADVSQATYMEYLHMQQPIDGIFHNVTIFGVPVMLTAVGSDGSVIGIGTTTSDVSGTFGYAWTPPKEDTYKIIATFAGSESYGSSWAETHVSIGPAPASPTPTPTVQPQTAPDNTGLLYAIMAAVIVAIIIGIVAILVALRKR